MNSVNEIKKRNVSNIFDYANYEKYPENWEERKKKWNEHISELLDLKTFLEKHIKENFRNLPAEDYYSIPYLDYVTPNKDNKVFIIGFSFTDRNDTKITENKFMFEIKPENIETKLTAINQKEFKEIFSKILFRCGYEAGFIQSLINRYETEIKIMRNEVDQLVIDENVINDLPLKTQYEATLQKVKKDVSKNKDLHKLEKYIKVRFTLQNDTEYLCFLRKKIGLKNISYNSLEKSLNRYRKVQKNP